MVRPVETDKTVTTDKAVITVVTVLNLFYASIYFNVPNRIASFISLYRLNYLPKNQPIGKLSIISNSCIINLYSFINKLITLIILIIITSTSCNE